MWRKLLYRLIPNDPASIARRATRLTIVGGRPPSEIEPPSVPQGIERVLRRAAWDRRFRHTLLTSREAVIAELADELTPTEAAVLRATPVAQLRGMIEGMAPRMPSRRGVLTRLAAALGLALAGLAVTQSGCPADEKGRPTSPPAGIRPDVPTGRVETAGVRSDGSTKTRGIPIDAPPPKTSGPRSPSGGK